MSVTLSLSYKLDICAWVQLLNSESKLILIGPSWSKLVKNISKGSRLVPMLFSFVPNYILSVPMGLKFKDL